MVRLLNVSTNPLIVTGLATEKVLYEDFVLDEETKNYVKQVQERKDPKGGKSHWIDGTHHERMHDPAFVHVSNADFEDIKKVPGFVEMIKSGKLQVVTDVSQEDAKAYEVEYAERQME